MIPGIIALVILVLTQDYTPPEVYHYPYLPVNPAVLAALFTAVGVGMLTAWLRRHGLTRFQASGVFLLTVLSWPQWSSYPAAIAFALIALATLLVDDDRAWGAGAAAALAVIVQPQALVGAFVVGLIAPRHYWLPLLLAAVYVIISGIDPIAAKMTWHSGIWLILLVGAIILLRHAAVVSIVWLIPLWAAIDVSVSFALDQNPASIPAVVTVALALVTVPQRFAFSLSATVFALWIVLAPPTLPDDIQADLLLAQEIPDLGDSSLGHRRTAALTYALHDRVSDIYTIVDNGDLVRLAPDYVLLINDKDLPIDYTQISPWLWQRQHPVQPFEPVTSANLVYGPDVTVTGIALDRERLVPDMLLRMRLDWHFDRQPEAQMNLNISLLDATRNPVVSVFPVIDAESTTYHALHIPQDLAPGVYDLMVAVDYLAGSLGVHTIRQLPLPFETVTITDEPIGSLGAVRLLAAEIESEDTCVAVSLTWETQESLTRDYLVFLHLTPVDSPQPVAQSDGLPLNGRYPTRFWQTGDQIQETRCIPLEEVSPGEYTIRTGFYAPDDGSRLTGPDGDALTIATVTID